MKAIGKQLLIIFLVYGLVSLMCTSCNGNFLMQPCIGEVCTFACSKVFCGSYRCPGGSCVRPLPPWEHTWRCVCNPRVDIN
ncbi:hypothetical protein ABFS83_07G074000 [Erythranthe nasuta]